MTRFVRKAQARAALYYAPYIACGEMICRAEFHAVDMQIRAIRTGGKF